MSDPDSTHPPPSDFPAEAKRRGGMDTLYSAPWFDEEAPAQVEVAPKRTSRTLLLVAGLVVFVLLPSLLCGALGVLGGVYYYLASSGAL